MYLSTRRGTWIVPRIWPLGKSYGALLLNRFFGYIMAYLPVNMVCFLFELILHIFFNVQDCGLQAKHRVFEQPFMINDALPYCIRSGSVTVKSNIKRFTENGVIFEGG